MKKYYFGNCIALLLCSLPYMSASAATVPEIEERIMALSTTDYNKAEADLVKMGEATVPYLIAEIKKSTAAYVPVRGRAMRTLCTVGQNSSTAFSFFIEAVSSDDKYVSDLALDIFKNASDPKVKELYPKLFKKRHDLDVQRALTAWRADFPDSYDYDGVPLGLLAESYDQSIRVRYPLVKNEDNFDRDIPLRRILKEYPKSKIAPLAAYFVYSNKEDLDKLVKEWGDTVLPSATDGFEAWAISGASVAPMAQYRFASIYAMDDHLAWLKLLSYYPDRLTGTKRILPGEYACIFAAYYALLEHTGDDSVRIRLEDEMLKMPQQTFRYDGLYREPYPEVYLRKARRYASRNNFAEAMNWSYKLVKEYPDAGWGYHGGGVYSDEALRLNNYLPPKYMVRFLDRLLAEEKPGSEKIFEWKMIKVGELSDGGKETEAEALLGKLFEEKPERVVNVIDAYDPRYGIVWWGEDEDTPLRRAYQKQKTNYLANKKALGTVQ